MALKEYYNTDDDSFLSQDAGHWSAQIFTAESSYDLTSIKLLLYRTATSPGTITVSVREVTGTPQTAEPTGGDLKTGTTDGSTLTQDTAGEWREITLASALSLTSGTKYAIVVVCTAANNSFALKWRSDGSSAAYTNGNSAVSTDGSSWIAGSARDNMFENHASVAYVELSGTIAGVSSLTGVAEVSEVAEVIGTVAGVSSVTGAATVVANWQTASFENARRLVIVGNDSLYYEDI